MKIRNVKLQKKNIYKINGKETELTKRKEGMKRKYSSYPHKFINYSFYFLCEASLLLQFIVSIFYLYYLPIFGAAPAYFNNSKKKRKK